MIRLTIWKYFQQTQAYIYQLVKHTGDFKVICQSTNQLSWSIKMATKATPLASPLTDIDQLFLYIYLLLIKKTMLGLKV